jgi:hypothetical protein
MPPDFTAVNERYLADFGEPVTLEFGATSVPATAVVDTVDPNGQLLLPGNAQASYTLAMSSVVAGQLDPDWSVIVRVERREILSIIPDGLGMSVVYLGDAMGDY